MAEKTNKTTNRKFLINKRRNGYDLVIKLAAGNDSIDLIRESCIKDTNEFPGSRFEGNLDAIKRKFYGILLKQ